MTSSFAQEVTGKDEVLFQHSCRCDISLVDSQRFATGFLPPDVRITFPHNSIMPNEAPAFSDEKGALSTSEPDFRTQQMSLSPLEQAMAVLLASANAYPEQPIDVYFFGSSSSANMSGDNVNDLISLGRAQTIWHALRNHSLYKEHLNTREVTFHIMGLGALASTSRTKLASDLSASKAKQLAKKERQERWVIMRVVPRHFRRVGDSLPTLLQTHLVLEDVNPSSQGFKTRAFQCKDGSRAENCFGKHTFEGGPRCFAHPQKPIQDFSGAQKTCCLRTGGSEQRCGASPSHTIRVFVVVRSQ
ncbi:MAG: hypothetical protein GY822_04625 [Deltaproteobacteria bacterium]|nr:hypothetical protein [Deltaproteobacteria bacterium]